MKSWKLKSVSSRQLGVHPRLLDLYSEFLTREPFLLNHLRALSRQSTTLTKILICGPPGSGKTTLAVQAWKNQHDPARSLVSADCYYIKGIKELIGLMRKAKDGDLLLRNFCELSTDLVDAVHSLLEQHSQVRLLATARDAEIFKAESFHYRVTIEPLRKRRDDVRFIVTTLLARNGPMTCSTSAMETLLKNEWRDEFPQLADCVFKSSWFARSSNRSCISSEDVLASLSCQHVDLWFIQSLTSPAIRYNLAKKGLKGFLRDLEAVTIAAGLAENHGNLSKLAKHFQLPINTLLSRCKGMKEQLWQLQEIMDLGCRKKS